MLVLSHLAGQYVPFNISAGFLFGHTQVISGLQVKPELRTSAEITGKPQGGIRRDAALFPHDVIDAWGWNLKRHCQGIGRHAQRDQVFLTQYFTGMDRAQRVARDNAAKVGMVKVLGVYSRHGLASMVIHYFNIVCVAVFKPETQTPLVVDPNAPLPCPIASQLLQAVARWVTQVIDVDGSVQHHELTQCQTLEVNRPFPYLPTRKDGGGMFASERLNHWFNYITQCVKQKALNYWATIAGARLNTHATHSNSNRKHYARRTYLR